VNKKEIDMGEARFMLDAGITQKEVARHFNILQPALSKKLKAAIKVSERRSVTEEQAK
jgi:DNA-binding transcriptional regulator LsrR (DeoR family)